MSRIFTVKIAVVDMLVVLREIKRPPSLAEQLKDAKCCAELSILCLEEYALIFWLGSARTGVLPRRLTDSEYVTSGSDMRYKESVKDAGRWVICITGVIGRSGGTGWHADVPVLMV